MNSLSFCDLENHPKSGPKSPLLVATCSWRASGHQQRARVWTSPPDRSSTKATCGWDVGSWQSHPIRIGYRHTCRAKTCCRAVRINGFFRPAVHPVFKWTKIEFRTPPKHHHSSRPAKNCHNAKNQLPREISCPFLALESAIIFGCDLDRSCQTGKIATFLMLLNGRGVYTDTNSHQMFAFSMEVACYTVPLPCKSLFFSKLFAVHWPMLPMCHRGTRGVRLVENASGRVTACEGQER